MLYPLELRAHIVILQHLAMLPSPIFCRFLCRFRKKRRFWIVIFSNLRSVVVLAATDCVGQRLNVAGLCNRNVTVPRDSLYNRYRYTAPVC